MKRKLNEEDIPEVVAKQTEAATPPAKSSFTTFGLDARLLQAITRQKFSTPTPVQRKAIPLALDGKDILARAQTGSGKTLAYLLPILHSILRRRAAASNSVKKSKYTAALILVPTKELATQATSTLQTFTSSCANSIRCENIARKEDNAVTRAKLAEMPDVVVATPSRASLWVNNEILKLESLEWLVLDEADLVLSYGYEDDLKNIADVIGTGTGKGRVQTMMMSATLRTETTTLTELFCKSGAPTILDFSAEEAAEKPKLAQYVVRTAEEDKFLLIYAIFKLQLIKGKVIVFVADIDRCYRVKLFLEQFGIRSCVLNSELPVNSRLHVVEEFNRGVYDIIIAADEAEVVEKVGEEGGRRKRRKVEEENANVDSSGEVGAEQATSDPVEHDDGVEESQKAEPSAQANKKPKRKERTDREYGISRGIDFRHVSCVLNLDLPTTAKSYTHRTGRTARAGQTGMALSFYIPKDLFRKHKPTSISQCARDEEVLSSIKQTQEAKGSKIEEWQFDMSKLEPFRYRFTDALRSVTRIAIREARTKELKRELINSERLQRHFEENPEELRYLRHDGETRAVRVQPHLKHVPEYLLPSGGKRAVQGSIGFVGLRGNKAGEQRRGKRSGRAGRGGGNVGRRKDGVGRANGRDKDPLRSLSVKGRGKR